MEKHWSPDFDDDLLVFSILFLSMSERLGVCSPSKSGKYAGAKPFKHLKQIMSTLNFIRTQICSQCNLYNIGVI